MLSRRKARYEAYIDNGMLPFEALTLSRMPLYIPYVQQIVRQRRAELDKFVNSPANRDLSTHILTDKFKKRLATRYDRQGWVSSTGLRTKESVWNMIRNFEKNYKKEHPEYKDKGYSGRAAIVRRRNNKTTLCRIHRTQLADAKAELRRLGDVDIPRVHYLRTLIDDMENEGK